MPELIAKSAFDGQKTRLAAGITLAALPATPIWSIALFPGQHAAATAALQAMGLTFPAPGESQCSAGVTLCWTGQAQAFLFGSPPPPALAEVAALTDQSGGWAGVALSGDRVVDALARLVPLDLRVAAFPPGKVVRAPVNHLPAIILRRAEDQFEIWTFRSMARTLWHELSEVLTQLEARYAS